METLRWEGVLLDLLVFSMIDVSAKQHNQTQLVHFVTLRLKSEKYKRRRKWIPDRSCWISRSDMSFPSLFSHFFTQESECLDATSEIKQKAADYFSAMIDRRTRKEGPNVEPDPDQTGPSLRFVHTVLDGQKRAAGLRWETLRSDRCLEDKWNLNRNSGLGLAT